MRSLKSTGQKLSSSVTSATNSAHRSHSCWVRSKIRYRAPTGCSREDRERLDVAHRNSLRLLSLVNTRLDFSRIEAGRFQANYEPTDLQALPRTWSAYFARPSNARACA